MVSQHNESSQDSLSIESKVTILQLLLLQKELDCVRGLEHEDGGDYDSQGDDDDYDINDESEKDAEPIVGKDDTSPRRYRTSEFPMFSSTFWGNSTKYKPTIDAIGSLTVHLDESPGRYRTSEFPLFSPTFWDKSTEGQGAAINGISSPTEKDSLSIESKVTILQLLQLRKELDCVRGLEHEDDEDYDSQDDDDDYNIDDAFEKDAKPIVEKDDTSPRRYRTSEFPMFSPSFWGNSTKDKPTIEASGSLIVHLDESPGRYRTSEFPLFSPTFWDKSTQGQGATNPSISSPTEKDSFSIESKVTILQLLLLQKELDCVRSLEHEDDDDYDSQDDDDDYDINDESEKDAEPIVEKEDTSPRRYRTSEFPMFSPNFWGKSTKDKATIEASGNLTANLDESPGRYRTSDFPLFSPNFWDKSTQGQGATIHGISSPIEKEDVDPDPRSHEGHKLPPVRQPIKLGTTLTSDDLDYKDMALSEKKTMEKIISDKGRSKHSANSYRDGIPTLANVRQKSLPPISKRQESYVTKHSANQYKSGIPTLANVRQKSLPPISKRQESHVTNNSANSYRDGMPTLANVRQKSLPPISKRQESYVTKHSANQYKSGIPTLANVRQKSLPPISKRQEFHVTNNSANQYRGGIPTLANVRQKSLPPISKRQEFHVTNNSANQYRGGIPTLAKVHQKSLPPISKRQESHVTARQKSLPTIKKREKPQIAETKNDKVDKSQTTAKTMPVLVRDPILLSNGPCVQGGPYEANPFKLLPPIAPKPTRKTNARNKNGDGEHQKSGNPNRIKVRHTKKSAQIERKAKAKMEAEKAGKRKAMPNVKPSLVRGPVSSASKPKGTATCVTAPEGSTPKHEQSILPKSLPPIRKLEETSCDDTVVGVQSVVAVMSEKINATIAPIDDEHIPRSSRSSRDSKSSDLKRSQRDRRSRSPTSRSSSTARSKISTQMSARSVKSENNPSRSLPPCSSSRNNLALRSTSPHDVRKSARVSTPGSGKYTMYDDTSQRSREHSPCTSGKYGCVSRRDRKPGSSSPLKSGKPSNPGSHKMKDISDENPPDNESDYSPKSTARSSVHAGRSQSIFSDTARTHRSASVATRVSRIESATSSNVRKQRPMSQRVVPKDGSTSQNGPNRPNTAPVNQTAVPCYPNAASSYPSSARHSVVTVRPNTASLLRQTTVLSRQSIESKRESADSVHGDTILRRHNITPVRQTTAPARPIRKLARPTTAPARPIHKLARPTTASDRPTTAPARPIHTIAHSTTAPVRPTTAPDRPNTAQTRPTITPARPTTAPARPTTTTTTTPVRPILTQIHRSTTEPRKIPLRIATPPAQISARSDSGKGSRNNTAILKTPLAVPY